MEDSIHIKGLSDLNKFMEQLTPKIEANVMRGALRAGVNVIKPVAQANIHRVSGQLADGLKVSTRSRGGRVTASLKATGPHRFIAHLVEFGTRAHNIAAKKPGWLSFAGIFAKSVQHPGAKPRPFIRPALDGQAQAAVIAAAEYMKNRLATKEGLDTSGVRIEGDE
jgi:HK97 gp10 family phage protein